MATTLIDNYKILLRTMIGERWQYYHRTVKYASKLTALSTGENLDDLLPRFSRRESDEEYDQRKAFTKVVTPAIMNRVKVPHNKTLKSDEIKVAIAPEDVRSQATSMFWGRRTISQYIESHVKDVMFTDPNAHLVIDFDPFDANVSRAKAYGIVYSSEQCLFREESKSGELETLVVRNSTKFICYTSGEFGIMATQITPTETQTGTVLKADIIDARREVNEGEIIELLDEKREKRFYQISLFQPNTGMIQARRIGYILDPTTKCRTCISIYHPAINRLEKTIKSASELDLTMALHSFPQKVIARNRCSGHISEGHKYNCNEGMYYTLDDKVDTCPACNGTGWEPVHRSAQDVIVVEMPRGKDEQLDLDNIARYITVDTDTPRFQNEYLQQLEEQCLKDVFASQAFSLQDKETATQVTVQYEAIYDVVRVFCSAYAEIWEFIVMLRSAIEELGVESASLNFPADLRLKTSAELMAEFELSKSAPESVRYDLATQVIYTAFKNEPARREEEIAKLYLKPMSVKTPDEAQFLLSSGLVSEWEKYLYIHFEEVWDEVKQAAPEFWERGTRVEQRALLRAKAQELVPQPTIAIATDEGG